ncbi:MAG: hypothetical protein ACE5G9_12745 [Nitrospinales bacterium]
MMKPIALSHLPVSAKVLVTCFLITLGFGNIAAGVYTQKYVVISYESLVDTYSDREHDHPHPHPHEETGLDPLFMRTPANEYGEIPITLDQVKEMPHRVDLKLLLQDAHVHLFSHGVLSLLMGILLLWTRLSETWKIVLIPLPFLGGTLDFAAMFLVKFVADEFAYLIIAAGSLTGISFVIVFFLSLYELWILPLKK